MKTSVIRWSVAVGAALVAVSFFLPPGGVQSPLGQLKWVLGAATSAGSPGAAAAFAFLSLIVIYPFAWAVMVLAGCLAAGRGRRGVTSWPHLWVHTAGGLIIIGMSILSLFLRDPWLPLQVQWTGAIVPIVFLAVLWRFGRHMPAERRAWTAITAGFAFLLVVLALVAWFCESRDEPAWGFEIGAAGALLALAGAACLAASRRDPRHGEK